MVFDIGLIVHKMESINIVRRERPMIRAMAAFVAVASVSAAVSAHAAESVGHPATTAVYMNRTDLRDPAAVKVLYGKLARGPGSSGRFSGASR